MITATETTEIVFVFIMVVLTLATLYLVEKWMDRDEEEEGEE